MTGANQKCFMRSCIGACALFVVLKIHVSNIMTVELSALTQENRLEKFKSIPGFINSAGVDKDMNYLQSKVRNDEIRMKGNVVSENELKSKDKIKAILEDAGMVITPEIESKLPKWEEVVSLYGPKPIIHGLDSACSEFQLTVPASDAYIGPAGLFNTGTNLLPKLLHNYCELSSRTNSLESDLFDEGILWSIPWGKHNPVAWRNKNVKRRAENIVQNHTLPLVLIKDPYFWMGSMCRHWYEAEWEDVDRCPNLVQGNSTKKTYPVEVRYKKGEPSWEYQSLADFWNVWYGDYLASMGEFPMLMIRYEDLLFHTEEVITKVCECGGGQLKEKAKSEGIQLRVDSAKDGYSHEDSNGLLSSIMRYGHVNQRLEGLNEYDLRYAKETIGSNLMEMFGYSFP